ncbi:MAG: hypothetical protein AAFN74_27600, partial [Myxococcota bacterium]
GRIALVDADTGQMAPFTLPATNRNCGSVRLAPDASDTVFVACSGFSRPFGDEVRVRATSGVYRLRIVDGEPQLLDAWRPREDASRPVAVQNVVPLSSQRFFGVRFGELDARGDEAFIVDLLTGEATLLFRSTDAFSIGLPAFDAATGLLVVPDSSARVLRRYRLQPSGDFIDEGTIAFSDGPLPPYQAYLVP